VRSIRSGVVDRESTLSHNGARSGANILEKTVILPAESKEKGVELFKAEQGRRYIVAKLGKWNRFIVTPADRFDVSLHHGRAEVRHLRDNA